jgi:hypothetical protein
MIRDGDRGRRRAVVTEAMMGFGRYAEQYKLGRYWTREGCASGAGS